MAEFDPGLYDELVTELLERRLSTLAHRRLRETVEQVFCAGLASYVEHRGDRPVQITWRLHHPLPGDVFTAFRATVA